MIVDGGLMWIHVDTPWIHYGSTPSVTNFQNFLPAAGAPDPRSAGFMALYYGLMCYAQRGPRKKPVPPEILIVTMEYSPQSRPAALGEYPLNPTVIFYIFPCAWYSILYFGIPVGRIRNVVPFGSLLGIFSSTSIKLLLLDA